MFVLIFSITVDGENFTNDEKEYFTALIHQESIDYNTELVERMRQLRDF